MKKFISICLFSAAFCTSIVSCKGNVSKEAGTEEHSSVKKESVCDTASAYTSKKVEGNLVIYSPKYSKVDLACGTMPSKSDKNVLFCAEAAFTGQCLDKFDHFNIAGDHVSGGTFHKGYKCKRNTGAFVYYNGKYKFVYTNYSTELNKAAENGGMGFCQEMMIHNGSRVKTIRSNSNNNEFRALCELNGRLCVIDSKGYRKFGDFIKDLLNAGVTEAIYMDMGPGWNYSWYRGKDGLAHDIYSGRIAYTTNWVTFYK